MLMSKNVNNESMTTADIRFSAQTDSSVNHPGTGCKRGGGEEIGAIFLTLLLIHYHSLTRMFKGCISLPFFCLAFSLSS